MKLRTVGILFVVAALAACGGSSGSSPSPTTLTLTAGAGSLRANGIATTSITVSGQITYPLVVRTTLGAFENGQQNITLATGGATAAVTLRPCDSAANPACAGTAQVSASDSALATGRTVVTFLPLEVCNDGIDNDGNSLTDCADTAACPAQTSCGAYGLACGSGATAGTCACPFGTAEICNDGKDNDCNGKVDCDDTSCQGATATTVGQACDAANPTFKCVNVGTATAPGWACKDTSNFTITLTSETSAIPANGSATTTLAAKVLDTGTTPASPVVGKVVTFTVGPAGLATITASATTDATGTATATLASASLTQNGTATATATYSWSASSSVTATATVGLPQLTGISLTAQKYDKMGAKGSGYQEDMDLTFKLITSSGSAYPAGLAVTFTHQAQAGSFVGPTAQCSGVPLVCTATGVTDASGQVKVALHPGTVAGVVSVTATAQAGSSSVQSVTASNLPIVGAKASGAQFVLDCNPKNVPALTVQDCTNSNYGGTEANVTCVATLADRYQNELGVPTTVQFQTEAGIIVGTATTDSHGKATAKLTVTGAKLPVDVAPFVGEFSLFHGADGCAQRTHNPRDGLVTIIAKVSGEEGFVDGSNGCPADGVYTAPGANCAAGDTCCLRGENFIDIAEPFVDANDNGIQDAQEAYDDLDNNGKWDGPNGKWDKNTTLWAQTRILYTDFARVMSGSTLEYLSRFESPGLPPYPAPTTTASFSVISQQAGPPIVPPTSTVVPVAFTDLNLNYPAAAYAYTVANGNSAVNASWETPIGKYDTIGMLFSQQYCSITTPTDVSTQCAASACQWAPCYTVAFVSGFSYGVEGLVRITGTTTTLTSTTASSVTATGTLNTVPTGVTINGVVH